MLFFYEYYQMFILIAKFFAEKVAICLQINPDYVNCKNRLIT